MKLWTAMMRLNQRYDAWALRNAGKFAADLDRGFGDGAERDTKRHLSVWDLLARKPGPGR